jgi:hypothetical protein
VNRRLIWIGLVVLAAGLIIGFSPLSARGASCGSAFTGSKDATAADYSRAIERDQRGLGVPGGGSLTAVSDACDSLRSVVRIPALTLTILGGGPALWVWAASGRRRFFDDNRPEGPNTR